MHESRSDRLTLVTIILAMLMLSILLLTDLDRLTMPSGTGLGPVSSQNQSNGQRNGELVLKIQANITEFPVPNSNFTTGDPTLGVGYRNVPLGQVQVEITNQENLSSHITNYTTAKGFLNESLPFSSYYVSFHDWRLNNSKIDVQIESGKTTFVNAYVNASTYAVKSFDIVDSRSSGEIVSWENVYAELASLDSINSRISSTFLITNNFPFPVAFDSILLPGVIPVSIESNSVGSSQWMSLRVGSPISIDSVKGMSLLVLSTNFMLTTQ